jgi:hypothetical protein
MHYSRLWRATGARGFAARPRRIATVQAHAYHRRMNPMSWQTHCDRTAMTNFAVASTLALTAVALASTAWAQTTQPQKHSGPREVSAAAPSNVNAGGRGPTFAVAPFVQPVLVARWFCNDLTGLPQRSPLGVGAPLGGTAGGAVAASTASLGPAAQAGSERRWTTQNTDAGQLTTGSGTHANAGWLVTTQPREDRGRGAQAQVQAARAGGVVPPQQPQPVQQAASAPGPAHDGRVACESAYPQFDSGLVLDLLIGIGAHHGVPRHDGRGGRVP